MRDQDHNYGFSITDDIAINFDDDSIEFELFPEEIDMLDEGASSDYPIGSRRSTENFTPEDVDQTQEREKSKLPSLNIRTSNVVQRPPSEEEPDEEHLPQNSKKMLLLF